MDIKHLILKRLAQKREVRVSEIVEETGFSRAYINRFFKELRDQGKVVLLGKSNKAKYVLMEKKAVARAKKKILVFRQILENKKISEDLVLDEIKKSTGIFLGLRKKIIQILDYAFTEMLNNAIEHSRSKTIELFIERAEGVIRFDVVDKGIGIFNNIMQKRKLKNEIEAIQDLIKGKETTKPKEHSGEGIFFTSKAGDGLIIQSSKKKLVFNNILDDIFIKDIKNRKGTKVSFTINVKSKNDLNAIFRKYAGDAFEFSKTEVLVNLYKIGVDYVSRSQARRILTGLEKFKTVILDFRGVETIGQAFADEVFRVWKNRYPNINIQCQNSNENIDFMIKRAYSTP
jgi:anti-sigma regulatory factor (Ser/Thr protein kinase)